MKVADQPSDEHIMRCRCVAKQGCYRDNFLYQLNQQFTTRIVVDDKSRHFKERLGKKKRSELSEIELCQLAVPAFMEVLGPGRPEDLPRPIWERGPEGWPHWLRPGQGAPKSLSVEIQEASGLLIHAKEYHWLEDGRPSGAVIGSILNREVSQEQVDEALPNLRRKNLSSRLSDVEGAIG